MIDGQMNLLCYLQKTRENKSNKQRQELGGLLVKFILLLAENASWSFLRVVPLLAENKSYKTRKKRKQKLQNKKSMAGKTKQKLSGETKLEAGKTVFLLC